MNHNRRLFMQALIRVITVWYFSLDFALENQIKYEWESKQWRSSIDRSSLVQFLMFKLFSLFFCPPHLSAISHRSSTSVLHLAIRLSMAHAPVFWFILILYNLLVWVVTHDLYAALNRFLFVVFISTPYFARRLTSAGLALSSGSLFSWVLPPGMLLHTLRLPRGDKANPVCLVAHHSCLFRDWIFFSWIYLPFSFLMLFSLTCSIFFPLCTFFPRRQKLLSPFGAQRSNAFNQTWQPHTESNVSK